jgi:hypothetical protein
LRRTVGVDSHARPRRQRSQRSCRSLAKTEKEPSISGNAESNNTRNRFMSCSSALKRGTWDWEGESAIRNARWYECTDHTAQIVQGLPFSANLFSPAPPKWS